MNKDKLPTCSQENPNQFNDQHKSDQHKSDQYKKDHNIINNFIDNNIKELCKEVVEWQDTGYLKDGKLRELSKICFFANDPLSTAEMYVLKKAVRFVAEQ